MEGQLLVHTSFFSFQIVPAFLRVFTTLPEEFISLGYCTIRTNIFTAFSEYWGGQLGYLRLVSLKIQGRLWAENPEVKHEPDLKSKGARTRVTKHGC